MLYQLITNNTSTKHYECKSSSIWLKQCGYHLHRKNNSLNAQVSLLPIDSQPRTSQIQIIHVCKSYIQYDPTLISPWEIKAQLINDKQYGYAENNTFWGHKTSIESSSILQIGYVVKACPGAHSLYQLPGLDGLFKVYDKFCLRGQFLDI